MSPADLYFLLRRHRLVLLVAVLAGVLVGWLTAPGTSDEGENYEATHTLIVAAGGAINLDQAALLATTGPVPVNAAEALGTEPSTIRDVVKARPNLDTGSLAIVGTSRDPGLAENAANAVATALIDQVTGARTASYDKQVAELSDRASQLRTELAQGPSPEPGAQAVREAAQAELGATLEQLGQLTSAGPPDAPLRTVESATAAPAKETGVQAPESKPARAILLGGFGLLIGLAAVFALDRLDTRIHTKAAAEAAFGFPVIAEIPPLAGGGARRLLVQTHPASQFVEAYRGLRSYLALAGESQGLRPPNLGEGTVFLITSPLAGEGKTTSVAHVSALLAEVGRQVLVVSGDFRRPRLHELFDRERGPGLTEVLSGQPSSPDISDLDLRTQIPNLQFLTSGAPVSNPATIIKRTPPLLKAARGHWDFVVVDSAPLLVANDSAELARAANGVIVLARSGRTTVDAAERTAELLRRIEAPVVGVVLVAASENPTAYRYYRKGYYGEAADHHRRHFWQRHGRRPSKGSGGPVPPASTPPRGGTPQWGQDAEASRVATGPAGHART